MPAISAPRNSTNLRILISDTEIQDRIQELARQIQQDFPEGPIVMIGILKGSFIFMADLARAIPRHVHCEFISASSYGTERTSSGEVRLNKDLDRPIEDANVLIVEDIIDTGRTLSYLVELFSQRKPKSIRIATLLDKPSRREKPVNVHYTGFQIPDAFVVGYGLDYAEDYRNLKDICVLEG